MCKRLTPPHVVPILRQPCPSPIIFLQMQYSSGCIGIPELSQMGLARQHHNLLFQTLYCLFEVMDLTYFDRVRGIAATGGFPVRLGENALTGEIFATGQSP